MTVLTQMNAECAFEDCFIFRIVMQAAYMLISLPGILLPAIRQSECFNEEQAAIIKSNEICY